MAMAADLEDGEDDQYPIEDILDKYNVYVEELLDNNKQTTLNYVFAGELDDIQNLKLLIGKRAYNQETVDAEGRTRIRLIIE